MRDDYYVPYVTNFGYVWSDFYATRAVKTFTCPLEITFPRAQPLDTDFTSEEKECALLSQLWALRFSSCV